MCFGLACTVACDPLGESISVCSFQSIRFTSPHAHSIQAGGLWSSLEIRHNVSPDSCGFGAEDSITMNEAPLERGMLTATAFRTTTEDEFPPIAPCPHELPIVSPLL